ncbi:MAG: ABC transporter ATP-binding protein [Cyanobacteria bacterium QH_8_48_120]|nr:MAG: ABC transporter ATP-binding protein [Cyanobacteria bacterium QH_8_48_120]PSP22792.1 MAG: ABC transporter ATP-binding protein [Cyanobacteria bacterium SW_8_48_13]
MSDNVLDVRNLQVQFFTDQERVLAVDGINFQLQRGQTLGIVGESGSGKSVTSLAIMGLVPEPGKIAGGKIWFRSAEGQQPVNLQQLSEEERRQYRGGRMAMIFQEPMSSLNPVFNIGFQLTEAIRLHQNVSMAEARRQAINRLQEVKLLASDEQLREDYLSEDGAASSEREISQHINGQKRAMLERYPHELSGGQLQRVIIAIAISCDPTLLIADEPTTALDVTVQKTILELLQELCRDRGMSMIFITHDLGVIAEVVDAVAVMYQGEIVEYGNRNQIFFHPEHPYTKGLLACRPGLEQQPQFLPTISDFMEVERDGDGELVIREKQAAPQDGAGEDSQDSPSQAPDSEPLLSVKNLQVGFPMRDVFGRKKRYLMAVNGISFDISAGETLGLVGESGCGKSTLARALLRLIPTLEGKIWFEGSEISRVDGRRLRRLRRQMQIVFQNPYNSLNPRLTIGQTVREPLAIHKICKSRRQRRERAADLLERVGLNPDWMNRYPHEFSGGQRQRVCIARALALNPEFVICDESVSALDVSVQAQVLNLLKELQAQLGLTYIFISHDLSVVKFMSDRIMVMNRGKIEEMGPAEQIYRQPEKHYTRQLIESIPSSGGDIECTGEPAARPNKEMGRRF